MPLPDRAFLCGDSLTLADICFVAEVTLFSREKARRGVLVVRGLDPIVHDGLAADFPLAMAHYESLCAHEAFASDVAPYLQKLETDIAREEQALARGGQA